MDDGARRAAGRHGACGDDDGTGPAQPAQPATVAAASAAAQDGTAGAAAVVPPTVRVSDSGGRAVGGVPVTFSVTQGGGIVATTEARTNADGLATSGTWMLGRTAGQNAVTATVVGLTPVTFTARASAGPAAVLALQAGDGQNALSGRAVPVAPAVRVTDALGNVVVGVPVEFTVSGGGGAVLGGTVSTDTNGVAAVRSWSLGAPGTNTLSAQSGALRATFTATALDPCANSAAYVFGDSASGLLDAYDCRLSTGQRIDFFSLNLPQARSFTAEMQGGGAPFLYLFDAAGRVIAAEPSRGTAGAQLQVLAAPAASYFLGASTAGPGSEGPVVAGTYWLRTTSATDDVAGCARPWIIGATTTAQQLTAADGCQTAYRYADAFQVYLRAGQSITVREASAAFDAYLWLTNARGDVVAANDDYDGLNSRITYTAPAAGAYTIVATSLSSWSTGAYTLSVQ